MKLNAMKNVDYSFQGSRESDFIEKILQVHFCLEGDCRHSFKDSVEPNVIY